MKAREVNCAVKTQYLPPLSTLDVFDLVARRSDALCGFAAFLAARSVPGTFLGTELDVIVRWLSIAVWQVQARWIVAAVQIA